MPKSEERLSHVTWFAVLSRKTASTVPPLCLCWHWFLATVTDRFGADIKDGNNTPVQALTYSLVCRGGAPGRLSGRHHVVHVSFCLSAVRGVCKYGGGLLGTAWLTSCGAREFWLISCCA